MNCNPRKCRRLFARTIIYCGLLFFAAISSSSEQQWRNFSYSFVGGGVVITEYAGAGGDITIPNEIDGFPVIAIGKSAFSFNKSITSVTIPDSVTGIGDSAFFGCSNLESITVPDSVTSIDNSAFYRCTSLESITIPSGVTSIGSSAFFECTSLESISIPNSVTSIGHFAFSGCTSLTSVMFYGKPPATEPSAFISSPATIYYRHTYKDSWGSTFADRPTAVLTNFNDASPHHDGK